ncbi:hypothetical protein SSX86_004259 [Deinandra increscens subsp. villosa]|uniref:Phytocyanin domain-containing protein n=1 Tax=Deinandra increscens subsp. villosa TaxID=3103831 RepID=A0AAP0H7H0_9ASTR
MANKKLSIIIILIIIETVVVAAGPKVFHTYKIDWKPGVRKTIDPARDHHFKIGDSIQFYYPATAGKYNVIEVDQNGFENCIVPPAAKVLDSGNDYIKLEATGKRWFICGVGELCKNDDVKVEIEVKPKENNEFKVGSDKGWRPKVNYKAWAEDLDIFNIGDYLVFKYKQGKHNVIQVDESGFKQCIVPPDQSKALTSGNDRVLLKEAGRVWFISGIGKDCENGMKVSVDVRTPDGEKLKAPALQGGRKLVPAT